MCCVLCCLPAPKADQITITPEIALDQFEELANNKQQAIQQSNRVSQFYSQNIFFLLLKQNRRVPIKKPYKSNLVLMFRYLNISVIDLFLRFDKNGDGFATRTEIGESEWKVVSLYDLNSTYARK